MLRDFCRDLKTYLSQVTSRPVVFVKIRTRYLAGNDVGRRIVYGMYLAQLFGEYRYRRDTYFLPYEVALTTLNNFREMCNKLRSADGNSTTVSFHVPREMRKLLDEEARRWGLSISELVRYAIERMINKIHGELVEVALTPQAKQALEELVRRGVYNSIEDAILDAITQLIQRYKSA
jgi:Arc/MetJ-type ribon-helix-helix transcriptional regulator